MVILDPYGMTFDAVSVFGLFFLVYHFPNSKQIALILITGLKVLDQRKKARSKLAFAASFFVWDQPFSRI